MCLGGLTVTQDLVNVLGPARDQFCQMYCDLYVCVLLRLVSQMLTFRVWGIFINLYVHDNHIKFVIIRIHFTRSMI